MFVKRQWFSVLNFKIILCHFYKKDTFKTSWHTKLKRDGKYASAIAQIKKTAREYYENINAKIFAKLPKIKHVLRKISLVTLVLKETESLQSYISITKIAHWGHV